MTDAKSVNSTDDTTDKDERTQRFNQHADSVFNTGTGLEYEPSNDNEKISPKQQDRLLRERQRARKNRLLAKQRKDAIQYHAKITEQLHEKLLVENQGLKDHIKLLREEVSMLRSSQVSLLLPKMV